MTCMLKSDWKDQKKRQFIIIEHNIKQNLEIVVKEHLKTKTLHSFINHTNSNRNLVVVIQETSELLRLPDIMHTFILTGLITSPRLVN